jgi:murein DD-endopeptidase MepM/ murein hydrolase activator NlpD
MREVGRSGKRILASWLVMCSSLMPAAQAGARETIRQSFDLSVPAAPRMAPVEGVRELVYELHLTNFANEALVVRGIRVLDAQTRRPLLSLAGAGLAERFALAAADRGAVPSATIDAGRRGIAYLEIELTPGELPRALVHEVEYAVPGASETFRVQGEPVAVDAVQPAALGAPLAGGPWTAIHHPMWQRGHRRVTYTVNGRVHIPGRFAVDFVKLNATGGITRGEPDRPADAVGYGAPVLAVADAVVAGVRDDVTESTTISGNPRNAIGDATGNYIALRLRDGRFAFYEHLKPGSVKVQPGDKVRRGQAIGALGFTGDTTGPHLHFHLADANSPLGAEGLPFTFERFTLLGRYPDLSALGSRMWQPRQGQQAGLRTGEWPGSNVVIQFDD